MFKFETFYFLYYLSQMPKTKVDTTRLNFEFEIRHTKKRVEWFKKEISSAMTMSVGPIVETMML